MEVRSMRGRVVLIDFWATWCGPCVGSIPHIQELHDKFADQGLVVIGHTDASSRGLESFIQKHKITYPISVGANIGDNYGVTGIPALVIIDADGKVAWQGHPGGLQESLITELLTKVDLSAGSGIANPVFEKKSSIQAVQQIEEAIEAGHITKGWIALDRLVKAAKRKPEEAAAAEESIQVLIAWTEEQYAAIETTETDGDVFAAASMAEEVAKLIGRREQTKPLVIKQRALKSIISIEMARPLPSSVKSQHLNMGIHASRKSCSVSSKNAIRAIMQKRPKNF